MKIKIIHAMTLIGLMIAAPIYAESKAYYAKKTAKVGLYLTEVATGAVLGVVSNAWLIQECKDSFQSGKCTLNFTPAISFGSALLLINGIAGLNKELEMVDKMKRLYKFALAERTNEKN